MTAFVGRRYQLERRLRAFSSPFCLSCTRRRDRGSIQFSAQCVSVHSGSVPHVSIAENPSDLFRHARFLRDVQHVVRAGVGRHPFSFAARISGSILPLFNSIAPRKTNLHRGIPCSSSVTGSSRGRGIHARSASPCFPPPFTFPPLSLSLSLSLSLVLAPSFSRHLCSSLASACEALEKTCRCWNNRQWYSTIDI